MTDRVTSIEVNMEPLKVFEIAEHWAAESRFSIHEKTEKRVLYLYNRHIAAATWVSIENLGSKTRLSAWMAPKSLKPDEQGSFWKGNKIALPVGFALGPQGLAKKNFNRLSERIKSESDDTLIESASNGPTQKVLSKDSLANGLIWLGVIDFLYGALNLYNGTSATTIQLFPELAKEFVQDGMVNTTLGVVILASSILLKKGRSISIWLFGAGVLMNVGLEFARGASFPFIPILIGVWIMNLLLGLKKQGQLT